MERLKAVRKMPLSLPKVDTKNKKKELVGNYANAGRQWRRRGTAVRVNGHDFPGPHVPRAYPYGIYDVRRNEGFVNVGTDHDTAAFAAASIRGWWRAEADGCIRRRERSSSRRTPVSATDPGSACGSGSCSGSRTRQASRYRFATSRPGTSKWNKVEHRLFSFITSNWRGEPLRDYETIVKLIARTTTATGLKVVCRLDRRKDRTGREISNAEMETLCLERNRFHGAWNYVIKPRHRARSS
jgi:hypothetical protein